MALRRHERTGRPLGSMGFLGQLEAQRDRELSPKKRGPKGSWKHSKVRCPWDCGNIAEAMCHWPNLSPVMV